MLALHLPIYGCTYLVQGRVAEDSTRILIVTFESLRGGKAIMADWSCIFKCVRALLRTLN